MILPSFQDLFPEQLAVYEQPGTQSILVVGPPGSGKTSMAIWRARFVADALPARRVVMVTRNRLLAAVAGHLASGQGDSDVNVTTLSSLIASDYRRKFGERVPQHTPFSYDWAQIMRDYATGGCEPGIDHLVVDEGQNLPIEFFYWAVQFGAKALSVFADEDQATLGDGTRISQLQNAGFTTILPLLYNHRNTQPIVDVMEAFHTERCLPSAKVSRHVKHDPPRLLAVGSWEALADTVAARFKNRAESIGVIVFRKSEVIHIADLLRTRLAGVRIDAYTSEADAGMESGMLIGEHGITVISGESAIGLEFDTVYLQDLARSLPASDALQNRRMYMLCARARDNLVLVNGPAALSTVQLTALPNPPILAR